MVGTIVSHYRVLSELGHGGMGIVYAAEDTMLGRKVALKFCSAATDPHHRKFLLREAKAASALTHPNIAQIYEFGVTDQGEPFIAMEYVPGRSLADCLRAGPLEPAEAIRVVGLVAQALKEAHAAGIVHRDIKPSNIRISDRNEVKVVDFGLAEPATPATSATVDSEAITRTMDRVIRGTPAYMSPEHARGDDVDHRSDLFSLGAVFYECLTGHSPFGARTKTDSLAKVIERNPPPPSTLKRSIDPALDRIVLKLLAKDPNERCQSAADFLAELDALPSRSGMRPPRLRAAALAVMLLALATIGVFAAWRASHTVHIPPPDANSWYSQGIAAAENGSFHKASKMFDRAVEIDPDFAMAHALLAQAWYALDNSDRAMQEMLKAMPPGARPRVSDTDWLRIQAIHNTLTRNFAEAARLYRELVLSSKGRDRVAPLLDLGRVYDRDEKRSEALDAYLAATRADPQSAAAFLQLGAYYARRQTDAQSAIPALDKAESLYQAASDQEGLTECIFWRARLETDLAASLLQLERALSAAQFSGNVPQIIRIRMLMSDRLAKRGDSARASEQAGLAVAQAESSGLENMTARAMIGVGSALFQAGKMPLAIPYVERALQISRRRGAKEIEARALGNLGSMLLESGRRAEAIPLLQQASEFYKSGGYRVALIETLILVARARRDEGDYSGAADLFRELIQTIGPSNKSEELALALEGIASVLVAQERYPEALKNMLDARDCYNAARHNVGVLNMTAKAATLLATLGKRAEADRMLSEQAAVAAADRLALREAAAVIALYAGDNEKARAEASAVAAASDEPITRCRMRWVSGLALSRSRRAGAGYTECVRARDAARQFHDPAVISDAVLAAAEAAITAGHSPEAERDLASVLPFLEKSQKNDSLWRAWALLTGIRSGPGRRDAVARAQESLAALRSRWPAAEYETYMSRPDVRKLFNTVQINAKE